MPAKIYLMTQSLDWNHPTGVSYHDPHGAQHHSRSRPQQPLNGCSSPYAICASQDSQVPAPTCESQNI